MIEMKILKKSSLYYNKICIYLEWNHKSKNKSVNNCRSSMRNKSNKKDKLLINYHSVKVSCRGIKLYKNN